MPDAPNNSLVAKYVEGLDRLEVVTCAILKCEFKDVNGLWALELDLLEFQKQMRVGIDVARESHRALRNEIGQYVKNRAVGWQTKVESLRQSQAESLKFVALHKHLYYLARRLGDAFAWIFFDLDRGQLFPLSRNAKNPPCPTGDSFTGMLVIAESLASARLGFPIFHDMTNILRVGDLSFVKPGSKPITVEAKTSVRTKNSHSMQGSVSLYSILDPDQQIRLNSAIQEILPPLDTPKSDRSKINRPKRHDKVQRQIDRMKAAHSEIAAEPNTFVTSIDAQESRLVLPPVEVDNHWLIAEETLQEARANGYSFRSVDGAFGYAAVRLEESITYPWQHQRDFKLPAAIDQIPKDLAASGIFLQDKTLNGLWFRVTASDLAKHPPLDTLPLYLHPYPIDIIVDLIRGRLLFFVFVNPGRLVEALQAAGYDARLRNNTDHADEEVLVLSFEFTAKSGVRYRGRIRNVQHAFRLLAYECLTLKGFVSYIGAMIDAAKDPERFKRIAS